jgi:hypothetical protein
VPGGPGGPRWPWLAGLRLSRPRAPFLFSVRRVLVGGGLLVVVACCPGGALAAALAVPAYAFGLVLAGPGPARGAPSPLKQWPACSGARAITRSPARPAWPPSWVPASLPLAAGEGVALLLLLEVCILWRGATTTPTPRGLRSDGISAMLKAVDAAAVESGYPPCGDNNIAIWRVAFRCCITGTRLFLRAAAGSGRPAVITYCLVWLPCQGCDLRRSRRVHTVRYRSAHAENERGGKLPSTARAEAV